MTRLTEDVDAGQLGLAGIPILPSAAAAQGFAGRGPETSILRFRGNDDDPLMMSASVSVSDSTNSAQAFGPIVGIAKWGSGKGGMIVAEFDVPGNNYPQTFLDGQGNVYLGGGVELSVPGSSLEILLRNDGNVIPAIGNVAIGSGVPSAFGTSSFGPGNKPKSDLFRTIWQVSAGIGSGLAAAGATDINVPPFAKTVRIFRASGGAVPTSPTIRVSLVRNGGRIIETYVVAADTPTPELPLPAGVFAIHIGNISAAEILQLAAIFTIGI